MLKRVAPFVLVAPLFFVGCGEVKQQKPPRIPDDGQSGLGAETTDGSDMVAEEAGPLPVENAQEETEAERRKKCCQQCVEGVAEDKSGDPPGALACKTLTSKVQAGCVLYFDKSPMNGKEAQACIEESAAAAPAAPATEGG